MNKFLSVKDVYLTNSLPFGNRRRMNKIQHDLLVKLGGILLFQMQIHKKSNFSRYICSYCEEYKNMKMSIGVNSLLFIS
jgi:hypothetical protein